jgi:xanthine dehydrogenase YagT iron-sulfur-binding subunit
MADRNDANERRRPARALAQRALHGEQVDERQKAEALLAEAKGLAVIQEQNLASSRRQDGRSGPASTFGIVLTVNGQRHEVTVDARTTLLDALRDRLHLTGTKRGCDLGQCGACTVLMDGRRVTACLVFAVMAEGGDIETIEGLSRDGVLHPMQQAFIDTDGFQCGYCTPGQIMSAVGLVREGKAGSAAQIREEMSGNICRCGAYPGIVEAIQSVVGTSK